MPYPAIDFLGVFGSLIVYTITSTSEYHFKRCSIWAQLFRGSEVERDDHPICTLRVGFDSFVDLGTII